MMSSDSVCVIRAQPMPVSSPSLFMRAPDDTIRRCHERCDIYVDTATRACTRRGRAEMARPCRPSVRTFFRALLQRALEALLQRGQFLYRMREAIRLSERWAEIAPPPADEAAEQTQGADTARGTAA